MRSIEITLRVDINDDADPQAAADEVFDIIGNEPLERIEYVNGVYWTGDQAGNWVQSELDNVEDAKKAMRIITGREGGQAASHKSTTCWGGHHPQCSGSVCNCACHNERTTQ